MAVAGVAEAVEAAEKGEAAEVEEVAAATTLAVVEAAVEVLEGVVGEVVGEVVAGVVEGVVGEVEQEGGVVTEEGAVEVVCKAPATEERTAVAPLPTPRVRQSAEELGAVVVVEGVGTAWRQGHRRCPQRQRVAQQPHSTWPQTPQRPRVVL